MKKQEWQPPMELFGLEEADCSSAIDRRLKTLTCIQEVQKQPGRIGHLWSGVLVLQHRGPICRTLVRNYWELSGQTQCQLWGAWEDRGKMVMISHVTQRICQTHVMRCMFSNGLN
ncbi:hypothetical protein V2G26_008204 [Clonostachys chloroleuca]